MRDQLARLAVDHLVEQDMGASLVVVPHVAGRILEVPVHLAAVGIPGGGGVGEQVVARARARIHHGHRIADAPDGLVAVGIVGAGHPDGTATGAPRIGLVLPGLGAGLAGGGIVCLSQVSFAGRGVERCDPVAHAAVAAGSPDDDLVLDGEWRAGDLQQRLVVDHIGLPHDLAGLLVGGDDAGRIIRGRDHVIAPEGGAAIGDLPALFGVHAPDDAAGIARSAVDLVEHAPGNR